MTEPTPTIEQGRHVGAALFHRFWTMAKASIRRMIPRFTDHAANERTFLAWVRTAIAVMAFGFLLERFDIFLAYAVRGLGKEIPGLHVRASEWLGLLLLLFGALIVLFATLRFNKNRKLISSDEVRTYGNTRLEHAMAPALIAMAVFLLVYVARQVIALG